MTRKATCTVETARITPARAGPAKKPTLSTALVATFAPVSSLGVPASLGSNADAAGGNGTRTIALAVATA